MSVNDLIGHKEYLNNLEYFCIKKVIYRVKFFNRQKRDRKIFISK